MANGLKIVISAISMATLAAACGQSVPSTSTPTPTRTIAPTCTQTTTRTATTTMGPTTEARVTYVGNSGFLITAGDQKVLIDALFYGFSSDYSLPEQVVEALTSAASPFDGIDLILASHDHADHFSADMTRLVMLANPGAVFISTTQSASQLSDLGNRVIPVDPRAGAPVNTEANGIQVEAIYISHGTPENGQPEIYNNAYVVTLDGVKFFHTGDIADPQDFLQYDLGTQGIDLAFIPHFYMRDSYFRSAMDAIGARYLVPIHYHYTTPVFNASAVRAAYPDAILFDAELDHWDMPVAGG
jgi:L-ascorbate metabolism protein UlaG (beta-lactamase superfamily)